MQNKIKIKHLKNLFKCQSPTTQIVAQGKELITFAALKKPNDMGFIDEIKRRRTFGIISHPDAGKTTLTEKLLLFGGAIHIAGAVKSNKIKKTATSDFMEIEKQRGISVATSVMGFEYDGYKVNILDTPGHQDFAEDTYRTLTAVDSVIIVIDAAKGVEAQTRKLMEVCRMRNTPVMVFINKMDRPSKDPFDLLDEIEAELNIKVRPLSWPIGNGNDFQGVYNIFDQSLYLFTPSKQTLENGIEIKDVNDPLFENYVGSKAAVTLREEVELLNGVYPEFEHPSYLEGHLAPVFFGSALNNFGVRELLHCFLKIAPSPRESKTEDRVVKPEEEKFSGFVFKIHANMDPNHRNRLAFVKICSGKFERNKNYHHVQLGRELKFSSPTAFMADKKSIIDEAYPGDIVGIPDTGNFKIGDSLTEGEKLNFKGLPSFSPELFQYIENADPLKSKQLAKGIDQLMDEGVAQLFVNQFNGRKIIGTVGALQFEVIQYRLLHEYGASCRWEGIQLYKACWIESDDAPELTDFKKRKSQYMAKDKHGRDVFLADSSYMLQMAQEQFKNIKFHFTSEF
ncbi:MAG: peptide chain release factor 3 [Breznakibacter sp.]